MDQIMAEIKQIIKNEYQRGYQDGAKCKYTADDFYNALKIVWAEEADGGMELDDIRGLFGTVSMYDILAQNTPEVIIEKVRDFKREIVSD